MATAAIQFCDVSKKYRIKTGGLSDIFHYLKRNMHPTQWGRNESAILDPRREIWALKDVSFEVQQGDVLGLIGPNGSGKSTILKILSRITRPTLGNYQVKGKVGALIEIGAGFHDELTGRENIFMNGAIMGMSRREICAKFDQIVEFSGLDNFIDTPLKKYSSGMRMRLGFSVASHIDPDILLVDEVLSVGDINFQNKSVSKMKSFKNKGIPIIFVSHSMPAILSMCDRVLYLRKGEVAAIGQATDVIDRYLRDSDVSLRQDLQDQITGQAFGARELKIEKIDVLNNQKQESAEFQYRDDIIIRVFYTACRSMTPYFYIYIESRGGIILAANMQIDGDVHEINGSGYFDCVFRSVPLLPGTYQINGGAYEKNCVGQLVPGGLWGTFTVSTPLKNYGFKSTIALVTSRCDIWRLDQYAWRFYA